jgi:hypothetical protein
MSTNIDEPVKLVSLQQIVANNTSQYTPFRVTKEGSKFSLIATCLNDPSQILFYGGKTFFYGGSVVFELDYKNADRQRHFLTPDSYYVIAFKEDPSKFDESTKMQLYIDIWNAKIFEPVSVTDPQLVDQLVKHNKKIEYQKMMRNTGNFFF